MGFLEAIKTCFKKYFVIKGRARRSEYWWFMLFNFVAPIPLMILDVLLFDGMAEEVSPLSSLFSLLTFIPLITVTARRLHDIDKSGWWQVLPLAPIILFGVGAGITVAAGMGGAVLMVIGGLATLASIVLLIVWCATDGHKQDNRFGTSPKYGGQASAFD